MKMKKLASILLASAMLLAALTGCSNTDIHGDVTPSESTGGSGDIGGEVTPTETTGKDNPLSLGRMEGGTYTNKYIGIACKLDENWTFSSADELQELPDEVGDMFEGSQLGEAMKDMEQIMDMKAESVQELATMNILYQKLSMTQRLAYATMTEDQIIDTVLAQKDLLEEAFNTAGITVKSMEKKTVTFLGEERIAVYTVAETQGIAYYILQLHNYQLGQYSATITVASYLEDKTSDLLDLFYAA